MMRSSATTRILMSVGAYQRAITSGDADYAPRAEFYLGVLLQKQGDVEGAKAAFQRALEGDHPERVLRATVADLPVPTKKREEKLTEQRTKAMLKRKPKKKRKQTPVRQMRLFSTDENL
jgi:tetratricopeptide (TPR) repeat protein